MTQEIITILLSGLGGFIGSFAAMRTDIKWIIGTLNRHDKRITKLETKGSI